MGKPKQTFWPTHTCINTFFIQTTQVMSIHWASHHADQWDTKLSEDMLISMVKSSESQMVFKHMPIDYGGKWAEVPRKELCNNYFLKNVLVVTIFKLPAYVLSFNVFSPFQHVDISSFHSHRNKHKSCSLTNSTIWTLLTHPPTSYFIPFPSLAAFFL